MTELEPQAFTIHGQPAQTFHRLPAVGAPAPALRLADAEFRDRTLDDFPGKQKILNIVPSLDTPVCQLSARKFNEAAARRTDTVDQSGGLFLSHGYADPPEGSESGSPRPVVRMMNDRCAQRKVRLCCISAPMADNEGSSSTVCAAG